MRIKFNETYNYAHNGIRVVRYHKDQIVDSEDEKHVADEHFFHHAVVRDKVASEIKPDTKARSGASENK